MIYVELFGIQHQLSFVPICVFVLLSSACAFALFFPLPLPPIFIANSLVIVLLS